MPHRNIFLFVFLIMGLSFNNVLAADVSSTRHRRRSDVIGQHLKKHKGQSAKKRKKKQPAAGKMLPDIQK